MREAEATPSVGPEVFQPSLVDRVRAGIAERIDAYLHPVSRDAMAVVEGSPLAASIHTLRPEIEEGLQKVDRSAVVRNLFITALKTGFGAFILTNSDRPRWQREVRADDGQIPIPGTRGAAVVNGLLGVGIMAWGATGLGNVGNAEKGWVRQYARRMKTYYRTEAGKRAAWGKGTGEGEALTTQVNRIVRRMTQDNVPTISGEYHPQPQGA